MSGPTKLGRAIVEVYRAYGFIYVVLISWSAHLVSNDNIFVRPGLTITECRFRLKGSPDKSNLYEFSHLGNERNRGIIILKHNKSFFQFSTFLGGGGEIVFFNW